MVAEACQSYFCKRVIQIYKLISKGAQNVDELEESIDTWIEVFNQKFGDKIMEHYGPMTQHQYMLVIR